MKNIIVANQVQTSSDALAKNLADTIAAYKAADSAIDTAFKAADKAIADAATALTTRVTTAETAISANKTKADTDIASAIANWASDRQYKADQITIRNKTFFLCLKDNIGHDPLTDTAGNWSVFTPGSANDIFANRSPTSSDVYSPGTRFWDVSFGADTPLGFVSLGNGAWQFLNQITLSKIRFFGYGTGSTYQSNLSNIKFFKPDGTQIPYSWFVFGSSSGLTKPQAGITYSGQSIQGQYNTGGSCDLEPSSLLELGTQIAKVTATTGYFTFQKVVFIYSNGASKTFTGLGDITPAIQTRYGDSIASVLGVTLTAAKLSDPNSIDAGRISGSEFVSAFNQLQAQSAIITALTDRIAALEAK